jgi:hypothetical protein
LEQSFAETKTATQSALSVFRARRADLVKLIWQIPLAKRKELMVFMRVHKRFLSALESGTGHFGSPNVCRWRAAGGEAPQP